MSESVRRRNPFTFSEGSEIEEVIDVLDEQEQEQVISDLRTENAIYDRRATVLIQILVSASSFIQLLYFLFPSRGTPFEFFLSVDSGLPTPLSRIFTLLSIFLHFTLLHRIFPAIQSQFPPDISPLSYQTSYTLGAVPPAVALFLGASWHTMAWWAVTPAVIFIIQSIQQSIDQVHQSLSSLEALQYVSRGA